MSLKKFLQDKEVKEKFRKTFKKPKIDFNEEIIIQPASKNYTCIGIVFDYILRLYISKINSNVSVDNYLIAEKIMPILKGRKKIDAEVSIIMTKEAIERYFSMSGLDDELIILLLQISHYDIVYRTGRIDYIPDDIGKIDINDVFDIKSLYKILTTQTWLKGNKCILNPSFNKASVLVSGADADLIIDDMLIDIKVTKQKGLNRDHFNQLIGYYILNRLDNININQEYQNINKLAIYSARYGKLLSFKIIDIADEDTIKEFCNWFILKAGNVYKHDSDFLSQFKY